jgi:hypothetical protein
MRRVSTDMQERIARNEATFRRINEDIERGRDIADDATPIGFVCECGRVDCSRLIELTSAEYERVRSDPRQFAIVDGHEAPATESVIERHGRYAVVRKRAGTGVEIAMATDPRA